MKVSDIKKLPLKPGVYLFKNTLGKIIYIGKGKELKKRVSSYFTRSHSDVKTEALVSNIASLDYIVTQTEAEALILEANLIKKHKPKFNIDLKDNKTYPFLKVTLYEDFPRVIKTRNYVEDGSRYFGPYTNVSVIYKSLEIIQRLFKIRTCKKVIKENSKDTPCLNYHIGRCSGACNQQISKEEYARVLDDVTVFLSGKLDMLTKSLSEKMLFASRELEFEKAAYYRDQLDFVKKVNEAQKVYTPDKKDRDALGFYEAFDKYYFVMLFFREGKLLGKKSYSASATDEKEKALTEVLLNHYEKSEIPEEILLPHEIEDFMLVSSNLNSKANVKLLYPSKGIKKQIVDMASNNAKYEFLKDKRLSEKEGVLLELGNALGTDKLPRRIEGFDISNTAGMLSVASMVSFFNGRADKKNYRTYKIKTVEGSNDVASIREAVARRYTRLLNEKLTLPDLILIDGGKGQVNAAKEVLEALSLKDIFIIGLAKKEEEIVFAGSKESLVLPKTSATLKLLQAVRDEAHRFCNTFHKKLRSKKMKFSVLDTIDGVGPKKKAVLMKYFKSLEKLSSASIEDIIESGLDKRSAAEVYNFFKEK
jgi:excinuclease ABC subunit C